jgi:hypothetical protein
VWAVYHVQHLHNTAGVSHALVLAAVGKMNLTSSQSKFIEAVTVNCFLDCRLCFPHITHVTLRLVSALEAAGPDVAQDMDLAAGKVTVDVIGLAAFACDLGATCSGSSVKRGADDPADEQQQYQQQELPTQAVGTSSLFGRGAEVQEVRRMQLQEINTSQHTSQQR